MPARQIVAAELGGFALIALGLMRGPAARLVQGIAQFRDSLQGIRPAAGNRTYEDYLPGQFWLAVGGGALVLFALAAYLTGN